MLKIRIILQLFKAFFRPKFTNRQVLTQYQQERLAKHLAWVKSHSPFYKKLQNVDFQELPIFDKSKMMENFDDLNTKNIKKETALRIATAAENSRNFQETLPEGITVGLSSGTSGNKGIFLATESERAQWVAEILQRVLPIRLGKKQKIAFFLRSNSTLYQSIKSNFFDFHFFDLAKPFPTLIEQVFDFQPDILIAPPSALLEIAQKIEQDNLSFCPEKVVSVAEVLEKDIQKRLEAVFKQRIHQVYQATEGFLGSTCAHGTLHLHEDLIYFEKKYIDDAQTAFYPIISDFNRRTQPMLRYELGLPDCRDRRSGRRAHDGSRYRGRGQCRAHPQANRGCFGRDRSALHAALRHRAADARSGGAADLWRGQRSGLFQQLFDRPDARRAACCRKMGGAAKRLCRSFRGHQPDRHRLFD